MTMNLENENQEIREPPQDATPQTEETPKKKKQYKCFFCMTYLPEDQMYLELSAHAKYIRRYAYAYHDKDVWLEDVYQTDKTTGEFLLDENGERIIKYKKGESKMPHFHLILHLDSPRYCGAVANWFTEYNEENTFVQGVVGDGAGRCWKYLIHDSAKCRSEGKYQYDPSVRFTNDFPFFNRFDLDFQGDTILNALLDLEAGYSVRDCVMKYGRDFIINFHKIRDLLNYMGGDTTYDA